MKRFALRLLALVCAAALMTTGAAALEVEEAVAILDERYVDVLPDAAYQARTLDELFAALGDPYTYYMTAGQYAAFLDRVEQEQSVTGLGAAIRYTDGGIAVVRVLDGGGAQAAGLLPGDVIVCIDGAGCVPADERHAELLRGEEGSTMRLTVLRGGETLDVAVERRTVQVHNTDVSLTDGHIGRIDCDSFGSETGTYFTDGVARYAGADRWIVDVRGNAGGIVTSAVEAAGAFVGAGYLVYLRDRAGKLYVSPSYAGYLTEAPAVVLTDGDSASAAELFASAVRDCGGGIIVGGRTFGKGVAQIVADAEGYPTIFDGDAMKLTAYRYYSAAGVTCDGVGVLPTLVVDASAAEAVALALCASEPEHCDGYLRVTLMGYDFFVAPGTDQSTLSALFSALAPSVAVAVGRNGVWVSVTQEAARRALEVDVDSRFPVDAAESRYADRINTLAVYGLVRGDDAGRFRPNDALTRAELCALLARVLGAADAASTFSDVDNSAWYSGCVGAMEALGLVNGDENGRFMPECAVTWQELVTVLGRLAARLNLNAAEYIAGVDARGVSAAAGYPVWAGEGLAAMTQMLVDAQGNDLSLLPHAQTWPAAAVTRGEAAHTLCLLLEALGVIAY